MSTAVVKMSLQNALRLRGTFDKDILHFPCFDTKRRLIISLFGYSGAIGFSSSDVLLPETSGSTDVELPPLTIYNINVHNQLYYSMGDFTSISRIRIWIFSRLPVLRYFYDLD